MQRTQDVRLGLTWARFFSLLGWRWRVSRVPGYDLNLTIPCTHGECSGSHELLIRIEHGSLEYFKKLHDDLFDVTEAWGSPSPAVFGDNPEDTFWTMPHGSGGGEENITQWVPDWKALWARAGGSL
jgi:hypothetical protein